MSDPCNSPEPSPGTRRRMPPVRKFGPMAAGVSVCVWENQTSSDPPRSFHSVTISPRRFWDEDAKQWRDAGSFQPSDLPGLIYLLQQALAFCCGNGELPSGSGSATSPDPGYDGAERDVPF